MFWLKSSSSPTRTVEGPRHEVAVGPVVTVARVLAQPPTTKYPLRQRTSRPATRSSGASGAPRAGYLQARAGVHRRV